MGPLAAVVNVKYWWSGSDGFRLSELRSGRRYLDCALVLYSSGPN